ncbi:MAG: 50S ribosomal protein L1 [Acidilobaceae archaeon]
MPIDEVALRDAISKALELGKRRFDQGVELQIVLKGVDPKSQEGRFREVVFLPHGIGRDVSICLVAEGDMLIAAKNIQGIRVFSRQDIQALDKKGAKKLAESCDWVLVRADLMGVVGKILGPALGPRGKALMPVQPNANIAEVVERYKRAVLLRARGQPQIGCRIGSERTSISQLVENAKTVLSLVESKLGADKIKTVYVKKTMSPSVALLR